MAESAAAKRLVALIEEHDLARAYPDLIHVMIDAQRGRISNSYAEYCLDHVEKLLEERTRVPLHLFETPSDDELNPDGLPDVALGYVRDAPDVPFGLGVLDQARTIVIAGSAGSGKTTMVRGVIEGTCALADRIGRPIPMIVFDSKAGEFGHMRRLLGAKWRHYSVHAGSWLGLNGPEGIPHHVWANTVCMLFSVASGLIFGTSVLVEAVMSELQAMGQWPPLRRVYELISRNPTRFSKKETYSQSAAHQLNAALLASGSLFDTNSGVCADALIANGESAVFDISNVRPPFLRMFIIWLIVAQVLAARIHRRHRVSTTECMIIVDEADQIVSEKMESQFSDGISPLGMLSQSGRELGVGGVIGLHALGNTSRAILTNAKSHFMFNFSDAESIREAARTLMVPRGSEGIFPALRPGECVCRLAQTAWPIPFLGVARFIPPDRSTEPPEYELGTPVAASSSMEAPAEPSGAKSGPSAPASRRDVGSNEITDAAHKLLSAWALHPFTPVVQLWRMIGKVTEATAVAARAELEKLKLAKFEDWRIKKKNLGLMLPTPAGWRFLNRAEPNLHGGGGIEHRHGEHWIAKVGSLRGFKTHVEWEVPGTLHRTDALWRGENLVRAFEIILTCKKNLVDHVRACLIQSNVIHQVTVIAGTQAELRKQKAMIDEADDLAGVRDRVDYECIDVYLDELFPPLTPAPATNR